MKCFIPFSCYQVRVRVGVRIHHLMPPMIDEVVVIGAEQGGIHRLPSLQWNDLYASSASTRMVTIVGACIVSFLFYQFGLFLGSTSTEVIPKLRNRNAPPENVVHARHFDSSLDDGMIPECAHDVFLTLHKLEGGGANIPAGECYFVMIS